MGWRHESVLRMVCDIPIEKNTTTKIETMTDTILIMKDIKTCWNILYDLDVLIISRFTNLKYYWYNVITQHTHYNK